VIEAAVKQGSGPDVDYGLAPFKPTADAKVHVKVSAAPWVPVKEVRFIVNGRTVKTVSGSSLSSPSEPFGVDGLLRFEGEVPVSELVSGIAGDAWLVIEAGDPLPLVGDLGGGLGSGTGCKAQVPDGVPDTTDNNGDGKVDCADVKDSDDFGPMVTPRAPADESDPNFHFAHVVSDGFPFAFTNPFAFDLNGNGRFDRPGVGGGK
jgi:hypothetical protein